MKHVKVVLALLLALSLGLGMTSALAEDELTTITVLGYNQGNALMGNFENSYAYEWLQEQMTALGIDLQIEYVEADQYSTTVTTRLATNTDLADMMFLEIDNVTLNNLINRGMLTSVDAILEYSDGTAAGFLAPDGEYSAIRSSGTGPDGTFWVLQGVTTGVFNINGWTGSYSVGIRQDWLDKLDLPMPTTIDEFVDTMIAFRENDANGNGIQDEKVLFASDLSLLRHSGIAGWFGLIMNNIGLDPNTDEITTVFYQDGFKDYVKFIKRLVDAGVMSLADEGSLYTTDTSSLISQNTIATMFYQTASMYSRDELTGDAACDYRPISLQGVEGITPTRRGDYNLSIYTGYYAFMNSIDVQAAAKLLDFFFTEPYWSWNREGLEGKDFEIDENGNKQSLTVGMTNDEVIEQRLGGGRFYMDRAVLPCLDMAMTYSTYNGEKVGTFTTAEDLANSAYGQEELAKQDAADPTGKRRELLMASWEQMEQTDAVMYQTNMATYLALPTDEEVETLDFYTTDLDMAMTDLFIDLINGTKDIDNLDEYLEELRALGLDEVIGVYQARYDRFKGEA